MAGGPWGSGISLPRHIFRAGSFVSYGYFVGQCKNYSMESQVKFYFRAYLWPGAFEEYTDEKVLPTGAAEYEAEPPLDQYLNPPHQWVDQLPKLPDQAWVKIFKDQYCKGVILQDVRIIDKAVQYHRDVPLDIEKTKDPSLQDSRGTNPLCIFQMIIIMSEKDFIKFVRGFAKFGQIPQQLIQPSQGEPVQLKILNRVSPAVLSLFV